jgi:hypothetical protein
MVDGGTEGCQALFDEETAREYGDARLAGRRRLVVDAYCLQHPDAYCVSAISLAAHLTGVCIGVEHRDRERDLNAAIQRWLNRRPVIAKPALPTDRGRTTIADLRVATDPTTHRAAVERWAADAWAAYRELQPLARQWVAAVARVPRQAGRTTGNPTARAASARRSS